MATHFDRIKIQIIVFLFAADKELQLGDNNAFGNIAILFEPCLVALERPRQTADFRTPADGEISDINLCPRERGRKETERERKKTNNRV